MITHIDNATDVEVAVFVIFRKRPLEIKKDLLEMKKAMIKSEF